MKHKTWFRLAIKAIGILLVAMSLPAFCYDVASLVGYFLFRQQYSGYPGWDPSNWFYLGSLAARAAQPAFGLYLFFGGEWIVNKAIPSGRPYCAACGYDLSKAVAGKPCPECGVQRPAGAA